MSFNHLAAGARVACPARAGAAGENFRLVFCLDGDLRLPASREAPCGARRIATGCGGLLYQAPDCHCPVCAARCRARVMALSFSRRSLDALLGPEAAEDEVGLLKEMARPQGIIFKTTPAMGRILRVMEDDADRCGGNAVFLLAKSLELYWCFTQIIRQTGCCMETADRRAVRMAQVILEQDLACPPGLRELAGRVGMSLSKFKLAFPGMCGLTPYAYLRQARMERAMYLIQTSELNITEVACDVGYSSPSRFTQAFAERFGLKPSAVRRRQ